MSETRQVIDALFFDSGVGGMSVLNEVLAKRPGLSFVYLADNLALPYGDKSPEWLQERVSSLMTLAFKRYEPKLLVVACNTVSTLVLPLLRSMVQVPVVGVVPAIKPAAALSQTRAIGLLATPATIQRLYIDDLIAQFAQDSKVVRVGSSRLVELAEAKLRGQLLALDEMQEICRPFLESEPRVDTLVLGCTHFPLLSAELERVLPGVRLVDSGAAIAARVTGLLGEASSPAPILRAILFTKVDRELEGLYPYLHEKGFNGPELLDLPLQPT